MVRDLKEILQWAHRMVAFYNEEQSPPGQYATIEFLLHYAIKALKGELSHERY